MGRKPKKSTKNAWKKSEAAKEFEDTMTKVKQEAMVSSKKDNELFVIDTQGSSFW